MADSEETNEQREEFDLQNAVEKAQNDPWTVLSDGNIPILPNAPNNPLREQITSEKYLESLEKRLCRLRGRTGKEARASEMIVSLQKTKENQLNQILSGRNQISNLEDDIDYQENTVASVLQRKINPDRQALNPVELFPLINNDFLAKAHEMTEENKSDKDINLRKEPVGV